VLILGLLLVIAAAALAVGAVLEGGEDASVELLDYNLDTTISGVFFVGMATTAVLLLGAWLIQASFGRARRRRLERKQAKAREHESVSRLEEERAALRAENERLAEKLQAERASSAAPGASKNAQQGTTGAAITSRTGGASATSGPTAPAGGSTDGTSGATAPAPTSEPPNSPSSVSAPPAGTSDARLADDPGRSREGS
jgi:cytoskeletal protein RodZ